MTNEPVHPTEPEASGPTLPTFEPGAPSSAQTEAIPVAPATGELPPISPPSTPYAYAAEPAGAAYVPVAPAEGAPAGRARWSGRKTAVVAGLAIVLTTAGAIGAAAAISPGSTVGGDDGFGRGHGRFPGGQFPGGQLPGGQQGGGQGGQQGQLPQQNGGQLPNLQNGDPRGGIPGFDDDGDGDARGNLHDLLNQVDPNLLKQLDPNLLKQLEQVDPNLLKQLQQLQQGDPNQPSTQGGDQNGSQSGSQGSGTHTT